MTQHGALIGEIIKGVGFLISFETPTYNKSRREKDDEKNKNHNANSNTIIGFMGYFLKLPQKCR
jgi:hypothetical protein